MCDGCGCGRFIVFFCRSVTVASSCFGCGCVRVVIGCFGICGCRSHWNGCMMLHGLCFGEEAGARNLVFFRVKWLQATMKGTSCVRRLRLRSVYRFFLPQCHGGFKLLWVCLCVRSYRVFWNLYWSGCIQAAIVICQEIFSILALIIFLLKFLLKSASKSYFFRFGVEIRFWSCNFRGHCT